jgi:deoxyuridine 5'-triphosphate nucleotidohydrolase
MTCPTARRVRVRTEDNFVVDLTQPAPTLKAKRLHPDAVIPTRGSQDAVGYDLSSLHKHLLAAGGQLRIPTGIAMAIPQGFYGRVAPRSGLAAKHGIDVMAGVIDPDYRGEIIVILINHGREAVWIEPGMRIAQLILERVGVLPVEVVDDLNDTARGAGGFGSSGQ